jgi:adenylate cyclase
MSVMLGGHAERILAGTGMAIGEERPVDVARLRTLRSELIDPTVASQNGRVFKRTGDGALVEFRSVVEAVRCAITVQNAMIERNVGMPADQRIESRIAIHLGDVVEESDGDLNIAARLGGHRQAGRNLFV